MRFTPSLGSASGVRPALNPSLHIKGSHASFLEEIIHLTFAYLTFSNHKLPPSSYLQSLTMLIKTLFFLSLVATTLSLPRTDEALEQRDTSASIASYPDNTCQLISPQELEETDNDITSFTLSDRACVAFAPRYTTVGVNWGDMASIQVFADRSCAEPQSSMDIKRSDGESSFCGSLTDFGCGSGAYGDPCIWNSVMAHEIARVTKAPDRSSKGTD